MKNTHAAVSPDKAQHVVERHPPNTHPVGVPRGAPAIIGMNNFYPASVGHRSTFRFEAEHAVELRRPGEHLRFDVQFPAPHVRELFSLSKQSFAFLQSAFSLLSLGNVSGRAMAADNFVL